MQVCVGGEDVCMHVFICNVLQVVMSLLWFCVGYTDMYVYFMFMHISCGRVG